jgi:TRAP transporter TAXI family solute receptor
MSMTKFENSRIRRRIATLMLALTLILAAPATVGAQTNGMTFFQIGTGGVNGTYYPVGSLIGSAISQPPGSRPCEKGGSCGVKDLVALAVSSHGSVDNLRSIQFGKLVSGFAQADVVNEAYNGTGRFKAEGRFENLRALANLYPEAVQVVARKESGVRSIRDLAGRRVSLDLIGSGTIGVAEIVLLAHELPLDQLQIEQLKPGPSAGALRKGQLDAFFMVAGTPTPAIESLVADGIARLLPITGDAATRIIEEHRFFQQTIIGVADYPKLKPTPTIAVGAQWIVAESTSPALVHAICFALWNDTTRQLLDAGGSQGRRIQLERALHGIDIPLHDGAERCYRELGVLK